MKKEALNIAMISVHSSPLGELGNRDTGGMSVYIREIARRLAGMGHSVDIFTRIDRRRGMETIRPFAGVRVIYLPAGPPHPLPQLVLYRHREEFFASLERFRQREGTRYDLVHTHYWLSGQIGDWVRKRWRVPHVCMFHTLGILKNRAFGSDQEPDSRIAVERKLTAECDLILAGTEREKQRISEHYAALPQRIQVVPCGVDLECFRPSERLESRRRLGLDKDERVILYVGRFDPIKGVDRLLAAAARLRSEVPLRVLLVGGDEENSPEVRSLQTLCANLSLQDRVTFAGRKCHGELANYYCAADVLVLPSYYESFGLVVLEALACGTPVVASQVGIVRDLVRNGINGWMVAGNTPESLAEGVRRTLEMQRRTGMSTDSIRATVKDYDWSFVAAAIDDQYHSLIESRSASHDTKVPTCCSVCGSSVQPTVALSID